MENQQNFSATEEEAFLLTRVGSTSRSDWVSDRQLDEEEEGKEKESEKRGKVG